MPVLPGLRAAHPFDYAAGHAAARAGLASVTAPTLRPGGALFTAYPLLSEPPGDDPLRDAADATRIGHNHWTLQRAAAAVGRCPTTSALRDHVTRTVKTYRQVSTSGPAAAAVGLALTIADGSFPAG